MKKDKNETKPCKKSSFYSDKELSVSMSKDGTFHDGYSSQWNNTRCFHNIQCTCG